MTKGYKMGVKRVKKCLSPLQLMFRTCKFPQIYYVTQEIRFSHPCFTNFIFDLFGDARGQKGQKVPICLQMMFRTRKCPHMFHHPRNSMFASTIDQYHFVIYFGIYWGSKSGLKGGKRVKKYYSRVTPNLPGLTPTNSRVTKTKTLYLQLMQTDSDLRWSDCNLIRSDSKLLRIGTN